MTSFNSDRFSKPFSPSRHTTPRKGKPSIKTLCYAEINMNIIIVSLKILLHTNIVTRKWHEIERHLFDPHFHSSSHSVLLSYIVTQPKYRFLWCYTPYIHWNDVIQFWPFLQTLLSFISPHYATKRRTLYQNTLLCRNKHEHRHRLIKNTLAQEYSN
jgi:hypothetical protein